MKETYNVLPEDYTGHLPFAEADDLNLWENHGWAIRSTEGDGDALLWASPYLLRSRRDGPFIKEKFCALQSMVAHVNYTAEQKRRMHDNDFLAIGWDGMRDLRDVGELEIDVRTDRAVWSIDDMRFTAAPPTWAIHGTHRDVRYDVVLEACEPAIWLTDRHTTALENGDRWFLVNARSRGQLNLAGGEIPVSGMGWHERHVHLNDYYDPADLLEGPGIVFHNGYAADLQVHLMARPRRGVYRARILHDGASYDFSGSQMISVETVQEWIDPRTRMSVPCTWLLRIGDGSADLELHVQAFARTFYLWNFLTGGVNILYWWIAESVGRFVPPSGRRIDIAHMKHMVHQNRVMYRYS